MTPEASVLCPMCGSEAQAQAEDCSICGYSLAPSNNEGGVKCARCGSGVPVGYAYCPVCGLDQRHRLARPPTRVVQLHDEDDEDDDDPADVGGDSYLEMEWPSPGPGSRNDGVPSPGGAVEDAAHASGPRTGRTQFVEGPPVMRPPLVHDDDRTSPVPGRRRPPTPPPDVISSAGPGAASASFAGGPAFAGASGAPAPGFVAGPGSSASGAYARPTSMLAADAVPGTALARLVLVGRDGEEGESFSLLGTHLEIGRTHGELRFPEDRFMSPAHARLERDGQSFRLHDTGSLNGVFLRIRGHASVYPGDLFMVGHQVLRLENVAETAHELAPAPDGTRYFGTPLKPAWGKLTLVGRGAVSGDLHFLRGAKVVFGREQGDILFPHDPFVSREHARLRLELHGHQMSVFLEDLGSANGTYVRIRGSTEIRPRDTFRIGDQILRLRLDT